MDYGIAHLSLLAIRKEPNDRSEMVSQLLFGESYQVLEETEKWIRITCGHDDYEGWMDKGQYRSTDKTGYDESIAAKAFVLEEAAVIAREGEKRIVFLGSSLPDFRNQQCRIDTDHWSYKGQYYDRQLNAVATADEMVKIAHRFLGTPYVWGGRSIAGVDCSGLIQTITRICGVRLPRDAYQQADCGVEVSFDEAQPGDLAFFQNDKGHVSHVGMICAPRQLIHASSYVRIDKLSAEGIWKEDQQRFSHNLCAIRRITASV